MFFLSNSYPPPNLSFFPLPVYLPLYSRGYGCSSLPPFSFPLIKHCSHSKTAGRINTDASSVEAGVLCLGPLPRFKPGYATFGFRGRLTSPIEVIILRGDSPPRLFSPLRLRGFFFGPFLLFSAPEGIAAPPLFSASTCPLCSKGRAYHVRETIVRFNRISQVVFFFFDPFRTFFQASPPTFFGSASPRHSYYEEG